MLAVFFLLLLWHCQAYGGGISVDGSSSATVSSSSFTLCTATGYRSNYDDGEAGNWPHGHATYATTCPADKSGERARIIARRAARCAQPN